MNQASLVLPVLSRGRATDLVGASAHASGFRVPAKLLQEACIFTDDKFQPGICRLGIVLCQVLFGSLYSLPIEWQCIRFFPLFAIDPSHLGEGPEDAFIFWSQDPHLNCPSALEDWLRLAEASLVPVES